jgi:CRISPR system Cascade subunit CasE
MYLTKVLLAPGRLDNAWEWHRALWTLFPGIERQPNEAAPFLYAIERMNLAVGAEVLMQSRLAPEITSSRARVLARRDYDPRPADGQALAFRLTANVTKAIRDRNDPDRKIRVPLIKEEQQRLWLERKLAGVTSELTELHIQPKPPTYFRKGRRAGKIVTVGFEGRMTVGNADKLLGLLQGSADRPPGIGPAKAFGCGLLLLRRTR